MTEIPSSNQRCAECGMTVSASEYHPYAACLIYKQCGDPATVRANLADVWRACRAFDARNAVETRPEAPTRVIDPRVPNMIPEPCRINETTATAADDKAAMEQAWHAFANRDPAPAHKDCFHGGWVSGKGYARDLAEKAPEQCGGRCPRHGPYVLLGRRGPCPICEDIKRREQKASVKGCWACEAGWPKDGRMHWMGGNSTVCSAEKASAPRVLCRNCGRYESRHDTGSGCAKFEPMPEKVAAPQKIPPRDFDIESHQGTYTENGSLPQSVSMEGQPMGDPHPLEMIAAGWCPICGGKDGEHKRGCEDGSEIL